MDLRYMDVRLGRRQRKDAPRPTVSSSNKHQGKEKDDHLYSPTEGYKVLEVLAQGSFGRVMKCAKVSNGENVAVKISKLNDSSIGSYQHECKMLRRLNREDIQKFNFIRALDSFTKGDQGFLVFELLGKSLREFLKNPLPLQSAQVIMKQLLIGLAKLKEMKILHTDIKPENIMMVNPESQPLRIKIIDFGLAIDVMKGCFPKRLQTRCYRAPEVLLGLPYSELIDIWSAGCVFAELLLGTTLFPGSTEYDQVRFVCDMLGFPDDNMLENNETAAEYFCKDKPDDGDIYTAQEKWRLKTAEEYEKETGIKSCETRKYRVKDFGDILAVQVKFCAQQGDEQQYVGGSLVPSTVCRSVIKDALSRSRKKNIIGRIIRTRIFLSVKSRAEIALTLYRYQLNVNHILSFVIRFLNAERSFPCNYRLDFQDLNVPRFSVLGNISVRDERK